MSIYNVQIKVQTMLELQVSEHGLEHGFCLRGYNIEESNYDPSAGRGDGTWIVSKSIEAPIFNEAIRVFWSDFVGVWSRIQFVGQAYCEPLAYATLLIQDETGLAMLIHTKERGATGLVFGEKCRKALDALCGDDSIGDNVFHYFGAAAQSNDLTLKMMAIFAALENWFDKRGNPKQFYEMLKRVFGDELKQKYWGRRDPTTGSNEGLRHRLSHGEYFQDDDDELCYQNDMYKPVISYFNKDIFGEELIREQVVNPQRLPWQNKKRYNGFIRRCSGENDPMHINEVLKELDKEPDSIEFVLDSQFEFVASPRDGEF